MPAAAVYAWCEITGVRLYVVAWVVRATLFGVPCGAVC